MDNHSLYSNMNIILLGASGSIGQQTLQIISKYKNRFNLVGFSIGKRINYIPEILEKFPFVKMICVQQFDDYVLLQKQYPSIAFYYGDEGLIELIQHSECEMVVNALVGFVGLLPSITSLKLNKKLCLANKESLVVGGQIINELLANGHGQLYPIDSEHVAIDKCLKVDNENVKKIIITASGGAFRHLNRSQLSNVKKEDALKHPTWSMGDKITIDSASMMNKCFEIIEAFYLFHYPYEMIDIILHDESYIHSMVLYENGLYRMDISKPDMRVPIEYALFEKQMDFTTYISYNFNKVGPYHFHTFDMERYPLVKWAKDVISRQGNLGAILNGANEEAVYAFLEEKISFLDIEKIINKAMTDLAYISKPSLEEIIKTDKEVRIYVKNLILKGVNDQ